MSTNTADQIEAIREMMASGHRSVRIETHTLLLWGISAALLILFTNKLISHDLFPDHVVRTLVSGGFIALVLVVVGFLDFRMTRRVRRDRDETLSFVQQQLTKVWWLLIGLVVLLNVGVNLFGGGYLYYGITLGIIGLALYIHGLFSEQMLTWIGVSLMVLGIGSLVLNVPFPVMKWLSAFTFGLGLPLLALILTRPKWAAAMPQRAVLTLAWLLLAVLPAWAVYEIDRQSSIPTAQPLALNDYRSSGTVAPAQTVVRLPAGTVIPVHIELSGNLVQGTSRSTIPVSLSAPLDVVMIDGQPDGRYRVDDGDWKRRKYDFRVLVDKLQGSLTPAQGPQVELKVRVRSKQKP